jgi:uncharacterized protein (UPF0261 family)
VSVQPTIAVLATLDTKGPEAAYIRDRLLERGLGALVIDCGILEPPLDVVPDVSSDDVARHSEARSQGCGSRARAGVPSQRCA